MHKFMKSIAAALPLSLMVLNAPIHAHSHTAQIHQNVSGQDLRIPVMFRTCVEQEETPAFKTSFEKAEIEPYTEGYLIGYTADEKMQIEVDGEVVTVDPACVAVTEEEKEELRQLQQKEVEEARKREEAAKKINASRGTSAPAITADELDDEEVEIALNMPEWTGSVLTPSAGVNMGPSGKETYYNLPMEGVVSIMRSMGNTDEYWVRDDGVKMLGNYVMVAAHLPTHPRGSLVPTSLGMGIVCDTGTFALNNHNQLDIAVNW